MPNLYQRARVIWSLGLPSVARVGWYRVGLKSGLNGVKRIGASPIRGPFFRASTLPPIGQPTSNNWITTALLFGWAEFDLGNDPPPWHTNLFNGVQISDPSRPWWEIPDFDPMLGDIKAIWELSRFDLVIVNAQRAREADVASLDRLNIWLTNWVSKNPAFVGPNWKCGQEASIRVLHLAMAAHIMGQVADPEAGLITLITNHLRRIAPTIGYAVGQNNNHGTSEAAALFVGGSWLAAMGSAQGTKWAQLGRRVLEERVSALIGEDGSFSQYSLVYHRLLLDTLSVVEIWRRALSLTPFGEKYKSRAQAATRWLHSFVDPETGAVPNLGANDGAQLIPISNRPTRDFRPSLQLAAVLHFGSRAIATARECDTLCHSFSVALPPTELPAPPSRVFADGGFISANIGGASAYLRFPRFKFRPSQADALHLDLWVNGVGLLRDAGSFSYAADTETSAYFSGTAGHNTIMFDDRDQMPRISRFLFGDWLQSPVVPVIDEKDGQVKFAASYTSRRGPTHKRAVVLSTDNIQIKDTITGFDNMAVLRWRLPSGPWKLNRHILTMKDYAITIDSTMPIRRTEILSQEESLHYHQKSDCSVLEVEVRSAGSLMTNFSWQKMTP